MPIYSAKREQKSEPDWRLFYFNRGNSRSRILATDSSTLC